MVHDRAIMSLTNKVIEVGYCPCIILSVQTGMPICPWADYIHT
jgi:hypothetical protein